MNKRLASCLLCILLAGCFGGNNDDLKQRIADAGKDLRGKVAPLPEVKPYEPFTYNAFDLPDPFKPRKLSPQKGQGSGKGIQPDFNRRKEALENYALDSLKMVGTLQQGKMMYAIIKTPDNSLYRVKAGNYMGQNFGIITQITEADLKLTEIVQDSGGDWVERPATINLSEEQDQQKK
jgi:type IV pilus assembly protein PilP